MAANEKDTKTGIIPKIIENDNYRKIAVVVGILGIALIFLSSFFSNKKAEDTVESPQAAGVSAEDYTAQIESSLSDLISHIKGAGEAKIMVTLERGTQYVYATEEKKTTQNTEDKSSGETTKNAENESNETTYIIVKNSDGSQQALPVTEVQPVIKGVVVVCDGGDDPGVQQDIINAVTTALNITSVRVCVIKAK